MAEPLAFWRDQYVPLSEVKLAINDAGFVFGATVTDLCRTFRHQLFRLDSHLLRFRSSAEMARVPLLPDNDRLAHIAEELVRHNTELIEPTQELCLCMFATPGEIGHYLGKPGSAGDGAPTLCMYTFPLPFGRYARLFREGARLITSHGTRHLPNRAGVRSKHRSRLHWWIAEQEVHDIDPRAHALLINANRRVTETAAANFLVVSHGVVRTPLRKIILGGISLLVIEELCKEIGIPFEQSDMVLQGKDLRNMDEAMLSSTPYGLAPVSAINGKPVPWPGTVFEQLLKAWSAKVGVDIRGQFLNAP